LGLSATGVIFWPYLGGNPVHTCSIAILILNALDGSYLRAFLEDLPIQNLGIFDVVVIDGIGGRGSSGVGMRPRRPNNPRQLRGNHCDCRGR